MKPLAEVADAERLAADSMYRVGFGAALALTLAGACAAILYCFPRTISHPLDVVSIGHWGGYAYVVPVPQGLPQGIAAALLGLSSDTNETPSASVLRLLEQGKSIGTPHSAHVEIAETGQGRFSHWGKQIVFSASDNSNPKLNARRYEVSYPLSPSPWIALSLLTIGGVALSVLVPVDRRTSAYFFAAGMALVWIYLNLVFHSILAAPIAAPDSGGYLTWSLFRTLGYPLFLQFYHLIFGSWQYLPLVQLNLLLAALFLLAYAIARISRSYALGWLFLVLVVTAANMLLSAADMLTEAPFSAFLMLHLAFMLLFLERPWKSFGLLAGLSLASAILIKSVGVVLLGPLILFTLFLREARRAILVLVLCPALLAWLGPSAYNLARSGFFDTSVAAGYALGGHIAWAIHPHSGSAYEEEARLIERKLAPVLAKRPPRFDSWEKYVAYTSNEYNTLLWVNVVPELQHHYAHLCQEGGACDWFKGCQSKCMMTTNRTLMELSKEAIAAHPMEFGYHVMVHDLGLWRDAFAPGYDILRGTDSRADWLPKAYSPADNDYLVRLGPLPPFKTANERAAMVSRLEDSAGGRLFDLITLREVATAVAKQFHRHPLILFGLGLLASLLVFRISRRSTPAKAYCYSALCLNAYFLGTALAQPSIARYAWTMQGVMAAFLVLGVYLGARRVVRLLAQLRMAKAAT